MCHAHQMHLNAPAPAGNSRCVAYFGGARRVDGAMEQANPQLKSPPNDRRKCKTNATTCNMQPTSNNNNELCPTLTLLAHNF